MRFYNNVDLCGSHDNFHHVTSLCNILHVDVICRNMNTYRITWADQTKNSSIHNNYRIEFMKVGVLHHPAKSAALQ